MKKVLKTGRDAHQILGHDFFELLITAIGDRPGALVSGLRGFLRNYFQVS